MLAEALMIVALFFPTENISAATEKLREAAKLMGCAEPRVSMRSTHGKIEVEVRCPYGGDDGR